MKLQGLRIVIAILFTALYVTTPLAAENKRPLATAGLDQRVTPGMKVTLVGSGRDGSGRIVRFNWAQVEGPRVTLQNANRSTARFTAPRVTIDTTLRFRLTVTDTRGAKGTDIITVTVVTPGSPRNVEPTQQEPTKANGRP